MNSLRSSILEKVTEGITTDVMLTRLEQDGVPTGEFFAAVGALHAEAWKAAVRREVSRRHAAWMSSIRRRLQPKGDRVRVVDVIPRADFYRDYYRQNRPLLLRRLFADPAERFAWTFDSIIEEHGSAEVEAMQGVRRDNPATSADRISMRLDAFINLIRNGSRNDLYLTPANGPMSGPLATMLTGFSPLPEILVPSLARADNVFPWMGPKGTTSLLHSDSANVIICQLLGTKRVILVPPYEQCFVYENVQNHTSPVDPSLPDLEEFPLFRFAHAREAIVEQGYALFIPVGWWHYVESMTPTLSVTMTNFREPNYFPKNMAQRNATVRPPRGAQVGGAN